MYVPEAFAFKNRADLVAFISSEPFGVLVSPAGGAPIATHVPFAVLSEGEDGLILGAHMARANPQWHSIDGTNVLAIFQGPHAYVSPRWYEEPSHSVPTWNYVAVHCNGTARLADDSATAAILEATVRNIEGKDGWSIASADAEYITRLKKAIVAIEIDVSSISGARKLGQNRTMTDRTNVAAHLRHSARLRDRELAAEMADTFHQRGIER